MHDEQNQSKLTIHLFFPTEHTIDKLSAFSMKLIAYLQILMLRGKLVYYKLILIATKVSQRLTKWHKSLL